MNPSTISDLAPSSSDVVIDLTDMEGAAAHGATGATVGTTAAANTASFTNAANAEATPSASAQPVVAPQVSTPRAARTMSILALSLGIASFFFAQSVVVPLAAIILGVFGLRDEPTGRSLSIWGIVLAGIASFGWIFVVAGLALFSLPFIALAGLL